MRDLTVGSIPKHLFGMASFIGFGLLVQTLYVLIDLYFVSHLGAAVLAGVASAASMMFAALAASQLISVGTLSLVSRAIGRKDPADAQLVFEQALSMGVWSAGIVLLAGYVFGGTAVSQLAADPVTAESARQYFHALLPSLALMFVGASLSSALRATGVVAGPMIIQSLTVGINIVLAPILIAGWGTGHALGAVGAGLASSIAAIVGTLLLAWRFETFQSYLVLRLPLAPKRTVWTRIAEVGLPSTAEFSLLFIVSAVVYWSIRRFGADAQAGFGVGSRVSQAIFLPTMAIAFAASPIAGQNFGAEYADRVRATFRHAALIGSAIMLALTLLCQLRPEILIFPFTKSPAVTAVAAGYLRLTSWNFVAVGLVFTASGMFQALGNTRPSVISSGSRLFTFAIPSIWLSYQPKITLEDFWWLSIASVSVQALIALLLLRIEFGKKLKRLARPVLPAEMAIP